MSYCNNTTFAGNPVKTSIAPALSFDLDTYQGTNSPDASAGVVSTGYGIRWTGLIQDVPWQNRSFGKQQDNFVFFLTSDDVARLWIGSKEIINKESSGLSTIGASYKLTPNQPVPITVEYTHSSTNPASMHIYWLSASAKGNIIQIVPATGQ